MKTLCFLLATLLSTQAFCSNKIYFQETDSYWGHPVVVQGGEVYDPTWGNYDLEKMVKDNPAAVALAQQYSHYQTAFWITFIPWMGSFAFFVFSRDITTELVSLGVFVGTMVPLVHFESRSRYFFFKAINTYNGDDSSKTSDSGSFDLGLRWAGDAPALGLTLHL